ncbi:MAG TPA: hypothetical protein VK939_04235 [Longimicrobiales bacterium]|nr:hypothetical protein [Longimicrobiales bacterium]
MAAQLAADPSLDVHRRKGKFGELRVAVDGSDVVDTLLYPMPASVVAKVRAYLKEPRP